MQRIIWSSLLVAASVAGSVQAGDGPTVVLGVGAEHTDNAYRSSVFERSEMKEFVDLDLGYRRAGTALEADVLYNTEFANYEHDTTAEDAVIRGRAALTWHVLPGRLQWDLSHDRSEQLQDTRQPDIRNNKQIRDVISTGPTFVARMGPVDNLVFNAMFFDVSYDDSDRTVGGGARDSDNQRLQGGVSWQHLRSKTDTLSLNYQYMESEFDDTDDEFQFQRVFGTYAVRLASGGYSVSLGANNSERKNGAGDSNGFMAQAAWQLATGGHRFRLTAVNELTDSGIGLGGSSLIGNDFRPNDGNFDVIDMVERRRLDFGYGYDRLCERCTLDFGVVADSQDFDVQPRDQEQLGFSARFGYQLTPTMKASLRAGYSEIDYSDDPAGDRTDERTEYALFVDWRLSRPMTATFWVAHDERDSDVGRQGYEELAGGVRLSYRFR